MSIDIDAALLQQCRQFGYELVQMLGDGAQGTVYHARHPIRNEVAIKFFKPGQISNERLQREIRIVSKLSHPNIVSCHEVIWVNSLPAIVMEYVPHSPEGPCTIDAFVQKFDGPLQEGDARIIFRQLIRAVEYLQDAGIASRDIKLENALLTQHCDIKLCDFGLSKEAGVDSLPKSVVGTPVFMAPEVIKSRHQKYDGHIADVWCCGILLYYLVSKQYPFQRSGDKVDDVWRRVCAQPLDVPRPAGISDTCWDLISKILEPQPEKRITVRGIQEHPFFLAGIPRDWFDQSARLLREAKHSSERCINTVFDGGQVKSCTEFLDGLFESSDFLDSCDSDYY